MFLTLVDQWPLFVVNGSIQLDIDPLNLHVNTLFLLGIKSKTNAILIIRANILISLDYSFQVTIKILFLFILFRKLVLFSKI